MYCLDTNIIIDMFRGDNKIASKIEQLSKKGAKFCINPIILSELYQGAFLSNNLQDALELIDELIESVDLIDFTVNASWVYGKKYSELKKLGKMTSTTDLFIASICIANEVSLITRNNKDFEKIKGLRIIAL